MSDISTQSKDSTEVKEPSMYRVVLWNDNYTPWNFVAGILVAFFNKNEAEAMAMTKRVHEEGKGIAGIYTEDIANTKAQRASTSAKRLEFPLKITIEKE